MAIDLGTPSAWRHFWNTASRELRAANTRRERAADDWLDEYVSCGRYNAEHIEKPTDWEASRW